MFAFDSCLSHFKGQCITKGSRADDPKTIGLHQCLGVEGEGSRYFTFLAPGLFVVSLISCALTIGLEIVERLPTLTEELLHPPTGIELFHPIGKLCTIVGACDEVTRGVIKPISTVCRMTSGEDRGSVLDSNANGL